VATDFNLRVPAWHFDGITANPFVAESLICTSDMNGKEDVVRAEHELETQNE
jgi:hypothetical protein